MPGRAEHPPGLERLARRIEILEAKIRVLETNNRNAASSVPTTGTFAAGKTDLGTPILEVGPMPFGDFGLVVRRQDGQEAFGVKRRSALDDLQRVFLSDREGAEIFGDSFLSLAGSDSAHPPIPWISVNTSNEQATSSASFVALFQSDIYKWGTTLDMTVWVRHSLADTASEIDVINAVTGDTLQAAFGTYAPVVVPAGITTAQEVTIVDGTGGKLYIPGQVRDTIRLQLRARKTAGTGTVNVRPGRCIMGRT